MPPIHQAWRQITALERDILKLVRTLRQATRGDISRHFELSRTTITQHIQRLIDGGWLKEEIAAQSTGGRKPGLIQLNGEYCYVVSMAISASGASITVANFEGVPLQTIQANVDATQEPDVVMDSLFERLAQVLDGLQIARGKVYSFGIGVPAPIHVPSGKVDSPALLQRWQDYSIYEYVARQFPDAVVQVANDVALMAVGELVAGWGRGHDHFITTKIATGIGCGIIANGQLYQGTAGYAGHIGHVAIDRTGPICYCGNVGCLEKIAAGPAIRDSALAAVQDGRSVLLANLYRQNHGILTAEDVGLAAMQGDRVANDIIVNSGYQIGKVLATLVSFFNPSLIVIGGGVSNIGPQLLPAIQRSVLEHSLPISTRHLEIRRSELGYMASVHGGIQLALDRIWGQS